MTIREPLRFKAGAGAYQILCQVLGDNGPAQILEHAQLRSHILTVRSRYLTASARRAMTA